MAKQTTTTAPAPLQDSLRYERVPMALWGHCAFALLMVVSLYFAVTARSYLAILILASVWLVLMALKTEVTVVDLHVSLGPFGQKIPLGSIVSATVVDASPLSTGGWGIRYSLDGVVTYSVPRFGCRYVRVDFVRGSRKRVLRFMSLTPERIVGAIEMARGEALPLRASGT